MYLAPLIADGRLIHKCNKFKHPRQLYYNTENEFWIYYKHDYLSSNPEINSLLICMLVIVILDIPDIKFWMICNSQTSCIFII